jgi:hypothetical protein
LVWRGGWVRFILAIQNVTLVQPADISIGLDNLSPEQPQ